MAQIQKNKKSLIIPVKTKKEPTERRSLYTEKMVFAKMLYDNKKIEPINYQVYLNWFDTFSSEFKVNKTPERERYFEALYNSVLFFGKR